MTHPSLNGPLSLPENGNAPKQLVIFLHGYGADGHDLLGLADVMRQALPDAVFVSPNAPFKCEMSPVGYQWFSLSSWGESNVLSGLVKARPHLDAYIDEKLAEYQLKERDVIYFGFSQGCMMSLYTALRRPNACKAVLGFSGLYAQEPNFKPHSNPPIHLAHGDSDTVVPFSHLHDAKQALLAHNLTVKTHASKGTAHGIAPDGLQSAMQFLAPLLD